MYQKPNFLIFLPDQHRGDWLPYDEIIFKKNGMEPLPIKMPNLKEQMKKGVTFTNAITPSPLCAPARACLAAGTRYKDCNVKGNYQDYPLKQETYYSKLKNEGYITAGIGKLDLHKPTHFWGLDGWIDDLGKLGFTHAIDNEGKWDAIFSVIRKKDGRGKTRRVKPENYSPKGPYLKYLSKHELLHTHIQDYLKRFGKKNLTTEPTPLPEHAYCDNWISSNAIQMLKQFPKGKPWHLVVNFTGPHDPWDVTKRMRERWKNVSFPPPHKGNPEKIDEEIMVRQNYAAMLENIDRNIGLILEEVKNRNEINNTIIIYGSDHGEMLGDFQRYGKLRPERGSVNIPLIISGPNIIKNKVSRALVELQDLNATLLDFAGISSQRLKNSLSLRDLLEENTETHRSYQISAIDLRDVGLNEWKMICDGRYKLIIDNQQKCILYDLKKDPWEDKDVSEKHPQISITLRKKLLELTS
ncbi:MAG: hypothetical protein EU547_00695 [Promethearchaeota archaeon]|nr:MAG: hypothetical protein EU547_00695 [Candidatus Lokiarchaeota archaeon]